VLADVAAQLSVTYAVNEWRFDPDYRLYMSPLEASDFGLFKFGWYPGTMFFVMPQDSDLPFGYWPERQVPEKYGPIPTMIGNPPNYRWIYFNSSGFHKSEKFGEGLIQEWLATNSVHPGSQAIFNAFRKSIKKTFRILSNRHVLCWSGGGEVFGVRRTVNRRFAFPARSRR
jgi:hypothetical protein